MRPPPFERTPMEQTIPDFSISVPLDAGYAPMLVASSRGALEVFGVAAAEAERAEVAIGRWFQEVTAQKGSEGRRLHVNLTIAGSLVCVEVKSGHRRESLNLRAQPPDA